MKKIIFGLVSIIVILSLVSCSGGTTATPTAVEAPADTTVPAEITEATEVTEPTEVVTEEATEAVTEEATESVAAETKIVTDSRGVEVEIPNDPQRIATVSDALVEEVMSIFGVESRVIGIGSTCLVRDFTYDFETSTGEKFSYSGGMNPANYLNPDLIDLTAFVAPGTEINFETLASLEPDVLIVDVGACTLDWCDDADIMAQGLERLESMGVPTIVLEGPNSGGDLSIDALSNEIRILGQVFNKETEAEELATYLEESIQLVIDRTKDIPEDEQKSVLLLGLNPNVRTEGGVGNASGTSDIQSYMVEEIVHANNAFQQASSATLNQEQILTLNPDVIILPTSNGYHPPRELMEVSDFANIQTLNAIQSGSVAALPWSPCNCDKRLEYPIDVYVMAVTTYPELFEDIDLSDWILNFYKEVYNLNDEDAMGLLQAQWLDWTLDD